MSKALLIIHHTPSPHCQEMFEAVLAGATDPEIEGVEIIRRPALTCSAADMLAADGYLLGSPANLGYISGALKHAFDGAYYQILDSTWHGLGGSTPHAYQASKAEQDRLAAKLWAGGAGASNWVCSALVQNA